LHATYLQHITFTVSTSYDQICIQAKMDGVKVILMLFSTERCNLK